MVDVAVRISPLAKDWTFNVPAQKPVIPEDLIK